MPLKLAENTIMGKTLIEWAEYTVNAINGCSLASPGCTNCYAMRLAGTRMKHHPSRAGLTQDSKAGPVWTGQVRLNEKALLQPLAWKRARRIFWNAHGDLFHDAVPDEWIDRVFAVCAITWQHTHMILTKRSARMREYMNGFACDGARRFHVADAAQKITRDWKESARGVWALESWPLPNVWLGVSVEDQTRADERIPDLLATPAAVRFISAEPLLGPVNLNHVKFFDHLTESGGREEGWESALNGLRYDMWAGDDEDPMTPGFPKLDWVIVGGESGPGARPMHPDWARSLRDQCVAAGVPFHFKQWGEWLDRETAADVVGDDDPRISDAQARMGRGKAEVAVLQDTIFVRVGKRDAGRLLDGVEHNGVPEVRHG